mgnify:CR=1 FL=1
MEPRTIDIKGAREHNLRNVSLTLPRRALICLTGVSGSGKSSLAFDTLYAEGQRRYIESLSSYARQFLVQVTKPDCDQITGLSPAIAIQQKTSGWNPRSTVGTVTGIHDFLRVLYARIGEQHCADCGAPIAAQSREQIIEGVMRFGSPSRGHTRPARSAGSRLDSRRPGRRPASSGGAARVALLAPVVRGQKGEFRDLFAELLRAGFVRARVDGRVVDLADDLALLKNQRHDIEVVVDRFELSEDVRPRLAEAVDVALKLGDGALLAVPADAIEDRARQTLFSSRYACATCGQSYEPPHPQLFSFNSPAGMCPDCDGLGERSDFDPELLIPDPRLNFWAPCVAALRSPPGKWRRHIYEGVARHLGVNLSQPWNRLPESARRALLYGTGDKHLTFEWKWSGGVWKHGGVFEGVIAELRDKYRKATASFVREFYEKFMRKGPCPSCRGLRLNRQALAVRVPIAGAGRTWAGCGPSLPELCSLPVDLAAETLSALRLTPVQTQVVAEVLKEVRNRLEFLLHVGLHYLTLDRAAPTLSGGESQRIRLAGQIGSGLTGVLYVLDEPSIGLHPRDNRRLLASLERLRDMGNTVIVVEHDEETMRAADHLVDFGPGPGVRGGRVVAQGTTEDLTRCPESITGQYLGGQRQIEVPTRRRPVEAARRDRRTPVRRPRASSRV